MSEQCIHIWQSRRLSGEVSVSGAKNAVLVIMASLIMTSGRSRLKNVPRSSDVYQMIEALRDAGAIVTFYEDEQLLDVDTQHISGCRVNANIMKKMRASILLMGPLLVRLGRAQVAMPGGCLLGTRPIDLHLRAFKQMGIAITMDEDEITGVADNIQSATIVLDYPSVGATENIVMLAMATKKRTRIINAALEPEVFDLIQVLKKMGADIYVEAPGTIVVHGGKALQPIEHEIIADRLEAGTLLLAGAITGGSVTVTNISADIMSVFLAKLQEMGHVISCENGVSIQATSDPKPVSFKTMPYPGFPTDLQAPMMAALSCVNGTSHIHETVFENRMLHARELQKMGAQITVDGDRATIQGVDELYGEHVIATDIRAGAALVLAGLVASGKTTVTGIHHVVRGYDRLDTKLNQLGADIEIAYLQ